MKKWLGMAAILSAVFFLNSPAQAAVKINPDKIDLNMNIDNLGVEDLRLYRNAIFARHCYQFKEGYLRLQFLEYQDKKCGPELYYGEYREFDFGSLTKAEQKFVERLLARENEIKKGQVKVVDGAPVYDRKAIVNLSQFEKMEKPVRERLIKNGFVAVPSAHDQLFYIYEENQYHAIPGFITVDNVLQLYHLYFDFTLRQMEEQKLLPVLRELARGMLEKTRARYEKAAPEDKAAARIAMMYFAVAADLAGDKDAEGPEDPEEDPYLASMKAPEQPDPETMANQPVPGWMDASMKDALRAQRKLIYAAQETKKGPVMGTVDYTQFTVRGHYTRTKELGRFFRAMMWLGLPGFVIDEQVMPFESALIMVYELTASPDLMALYHTIYNPTAFYVGPTDDITPALVKKVAEEICGKGAPLDKWIAKKEEIRKEVLKRNPVRIPIQAPDDRGKPQVKFMGQRYIPDSEILQRLSHWEKRPFPTGVDIFGVMKVPAALEILKDMKISWDGYWPEMERLQLKFADFKPEPGEELNLYWRWMRALKTLNNPAPEGAAPFMRTRPWELKNLNTALASWAELRHDTILYAKASVAECGGDEPLEPMVPQYIEARPDVFKELLDLQSFTLSRLSADRLITSGIEDVGGRIKELFAFLAEVSAKQTRGEKLSDAEFTQLRYFGATLESLTTAVLLDGYGDWSLVTGTDRSIAVIADVHTANKGYLEEAVGHADVIYALAEINGYLYITRGAALSYHEFVSNERLNDEKWQQQLKDGNAPPRPSWIAPYFLDQKPAPLPEAGSYDTGC